MKRLKAFFGNQAGLSARVIAAALLIGTACSWYAILKPELKIKTDESESLRRRIEAAIAPGREYINSPVLVRTGNKRYLLTIQETKRANNAYKAELADYLKSLAKSETRAQLDVVYAKSPTLLVKSAVAALFNSSSAPFFLGVLFIALVRLFYSPILALANGLAPWLEARKQRNAERRAARATLLAEQAEREEAQRILDLELADLQAEADKAFAAQAATAESQRLAYEAAQAAVTPGTITQIEITPEEIGIAQAGTSFEFESEIGDEADFVQVTSVADILAKVPTATQSLDAAFAAPLANAAEIAPLSDESVPEPTISEASGVTFIEEVSTREASTPTAKTATLAPHRPSLFASIAATVARFADKRERSRDRARVAKAKAAFEKNQSVLNQDLRAEVDRLTSQLNGAKNSWLETATRLQEMKRSTQKVAESTQPVMTDVTLDLAKLDFVESTTEAHSPSASKEASHTRDADFI